MSTRALRWSSPLARYNILHGRSSPSTCRQYSSLLSRTRTSTPSRNSNPGPPSPCRILHPFPRHPPPALAVRFASTTPLVEKLSTVDSEIAETLAPPPSDPFLPDLDVLESASESVIYTQYGFLKDLGLDFGWGPTAVMEWSLEHVHLILGTPWWLSISLTMLVTRAILFKTYLVSADMSARVAVVKLHLKDLEARIQKAKLANDTVTVLRGTQEMKQAFKSAGINVWKGLGPFINIPFGYGTFRLTRNMATLPVPGLETGGVLWFYDLTVADPYFILPILTGAGTYLMFKLGGETGARSGIPGPALKVMQNVLPFVSMAFTAFWPAGMQIAFAFSSIMATVQAVLFQQPWFRSFWALQPLPKPEDSPRSSEFKGMIIPTQGRAVSSETEGAEAPKKSLLGNLKDKGRAFAKSAQQQPSGRRSSAEIRQARMYEEKRRKEIDEVKAQRQKERGH